MDYDQAADALRHLRSTLGDNTILEEAANFFTPEEIGRPPNQAHKNRRPQVVKPEEGSGGACTGWVGWDEPTYLQ